MQKIISFHQFILEKQSILESHDQTDYTNFWTCPPQNFFINFVSTCKRSGYLVNLFWRYFWLIKKSCSLIDWEHFGPYLRDKNFPKYRICAEDGQTLLHRTFRLPLGVQLATFFVKSVLNVLFKQYQYIYVTWFWEFKASCKGQIVIYQPNQN